MNPNFDNSDPLSFSQTSVQGFIQRVYQWMSAGLAVTGFVALSVAGNTHWLQAIAHWFWVFAIAELGLVIWLSAAISRSRISSQAAILGFLAYALLNGLTLSFIFAVYTGASIANTFFITAGTFAGVSFFGWVTKSDLTSLRGFFFMGLIGLVIASVVNLFFHSPVFYWILTYAGLALFIGLTAFDTQRLKAMHQSGVATSDQIAILGALILYLDFINMFLYLLRLFGRRRG